MLRDPPISYHSYPDTFMFDPDINPAVFQEKCLYAKSYRERESEKYITPHDSNSINESTAVQQLTSTLKRNLTLQSLRVFSPRPRPQKSGFWNGSKDTYRSLAATPGETAA